MFWKNFQRGVASFVTLTFVVAACVLAQSKAPDDHRGHDHRPKVTVKGMCCNVEAKAATTELMKVRGVSKVIPDVKAGTLTIEPDKKKSPSAKEIWEATEKAKLKVVQLTMGHDKFTSKPKK
jgi:copper chaperone CopZ